MNNNIVYDRLVVPVGLHYYGITVNLESRKQYKTTSLQQYINEYGWDNINTIIVAEGLTRKEAELLEDRLIKEGWERGDCINKQGSGGESRDNPVEYHHKQYQDNIEEVKKRHSRYNQEHKDDLKEYHKQYRQDHKEEINQYYQDHKEEIKEYRKQYYDEHRDEILENRKQYYQEHKEGKKQYNKLYNKQRLSTPAGKIYNRVNNYNKYHPDRMIITAMEAKDMYELTGYIPNFIKNNDL